MLAQLLFVAATVIGGDPAVPPPPPPVAPAPRVIVAQAQSLPLPLPTPPAAPAAGSVPGPYTRTNPRPGEEACLVADCSRINGQRTEVLDMGDGTFAIHNAENHEADPGYEAGLNARLCAAKPWSC